MLYANVQDTPSDWSKIGVFMPLSIDVHMHLARLLHISKRYWCHFVGYRSLIGVKL